MRDLIVKINTDAVGVVGGVTTANQQLTTNRNNSSRLNVDDPAVSTRALSLTVGSLGQDDGDSTDDGSDSGTAGTPTSQSAGYWPDLEVLDPDHPM